MNADAVETTAVPEPADLPCLDVREGRPVVNVRDENLWAHDPRTCDALAELREHDVDTEVIYEGIVRDFWDHYAPEAACEVGYSGTVYSAGRSGGWIFADDAPDFLEYLDATNPWSDDGGVDKEAHAFYHGDGDTYITAALRDRDQFLCFAAAIKGTMELAEQEFVDALNEAVRDLRERQEAAIVRGEN